MVLKTNQRKAFEAWFLSLPETNSHELSITQGVYDNESVHTLFAGFCAGWLMRRIIKEL